MEEFERTPPKKIWQYLLRGVGSFAILFVLKHLTTSRLSSFVTKDIPNQLFYTFATLAILLIYNSIVHTLTFYDADAFDTFKKRKVTKLSFGNELLLILKSKEFWLETLPVAALSILFSLIGGFYETVYTVFFIGKAPSWAFSVIPVSSIPILLFAVSLICRYEIHRYWLELIKKGEENRVEGKVKFVLKLVLIFTMYPLVYPYAPYILFVTITFFGLVGALVSILSVLGFILALAGAVLGIFALLKWKNKRLRDKFLNKLKSATEKKGELLEIYSKEKRAELGFDFTLSSGGKTYCCKIINALTKSTPLYFSSASDAYFLHRIGTKEHHVSLENHIDYSFQAPGQKLIILIKFPKKLYATEYGATRKLFSGDRIWKYIIYDTASFLGAFDRECLYRSNEENR